MTRAGMVALLTIFLMATAGAAPSASQYTATVGKTKIRIALPPGVQTPPGRKPANSPSVYFLELGENGKAKLRIQINVLASGRDVPHNDKQIREAMTAMVHGTHMTIPDTEIKYEKIPATNPAFDLVHSLYLVKNAEGKMIIISPNILISKKKDVVVPFTVIGLILGPHPSNAEVEKARDYVQGTVRAMSRSASLSLAPALTPPA
jgi:hypothetical protein